MVKIVFKNGIEVTVDITGKAIMLSDEDNWGRDIDTEEDSITITDYNDNMVFCGKWSEVLYIQKI